MSYFHTQKKQDLHIKLPLSILAFLIVVIFIINTASSMSVETQQKEQETLQQALNESTVQFYALEGFYPEDLDQLLSTFNITYNNAKYRIDYQVQGSNIYPEITILRKTKQ